MRLSVGDQALLSDCQSAALVSSGGCVSWWPAPRFDSASAFTALLDDDAGHWTICPAEPFESERRYRDDTLVLETLMQTETGAVKVIDALVFAHGARGHEIGRDVPHALARVVEGIEGDVELAVEFVPRPEYGLAVPQLVEDDEGLATRGGPERLFLRGDRPLEAAESSARGAFMLRAGETVGWIVHRVAGALAEAPPLLDPHAAIADTTAAWRSWCELHEHFEGEHADAVRFAGIVTQGLTYQPSGAVVAAPTTSLPEIRGGHSNWDYRYGWLRDAAMIARALSIATCSDEAVRYFDWIVHAGTGCSDDDHVQVVFGVDGERDLSEHELTHLDGHGGARPVRVGNAAWEQTQLDVLGHVLDCAWVLRDDLDLGEPVTRRFLRQLADRAAEEWREPDSGIWEGREDERHYTVSKLGCWTALDRAVRLADRLGGDAAAWAEARDEVRETILRESWCEERNAFAGSLGSDHLDAGVLLMPLVEFLPADDPRMASTIAAIEDELGHDGLLRRWTGAEDGAFLLASFWLAECHARAGALDRADAVFARAAGAANDVGLLAEEVELASGEALGNTPQAISHVGLVTAAVAITEARSRRPA
ncbi:MAG: glycoside hydrolase family 15 protein [Solirubrobacteraceae bacterium]